MAGIVLVALLGVSGTSLAVHAPFLEGRWDASRAATDLATRLQGIDGVRSADAVYDPVGLPEPTLTVDVAFSGSSPAGSWGRASAVVRSAAAGQDLTGTTTTAAFRQSGSGSRVEVEPLLFSSGVVTREITGWRALRTAFGDRISLHLGRASGYTDGTGRRTREYHVRTAADMRAIAVAWPATAPAVDASLPTSWSAPGLQLSAMPSSAVMHAVSALADVLPLAPVAAGSGSDLTQTGTFVAVLGNVRGFQVSIVALRHGAPAPARPDAQLVAGTRVALASGAAQVDWVTSSGVPSIIAGECGSYQLGGRTVATSFSTNAVDDRFAETLTAAGLDLPAGVRGGVCT